MINDYIKREDAIMTAMNYKGSGNAQDTILKDIEKFENGCRKESFIKRLRRKKRIGRGDQ